MSTEQWTEAFSQPLCYYTEILEFHRVPLSPIISDFKHFVELIYLKKVLEFQWWSEVGQVLIVTQVIKKLQTICLFYLEVESFRCPKSLWWFYQ